ncbi:MAG: hypothetical protein VX938_06740, partial [Myxococcota bacterium]|nr:hypothetical protein [Myxococcota bacterium]
MRSWPYRTLTLAVLLSALTGCFAASDSVDSGIALPPMASSGAASSTEDGWSYSGVHEGDSADMPEPAWLPSGEREGEVVGPDGTCVNPDDVTHIVNDPLLLDIPLLMEITTGCAGSELGLEDCVREAFEALASMSFLCTSCFVDRAICVVERCLGHCSEEPEGVPCACCREFEGCRGDFRECSGLPIGLG